MQMWEGYLWRQEHQENMFAFYTCHLMNVEGKSLKRPVNPKDLLKPLRKTEQKTSKSEDEKYLREKFGLQGGA